MSQSLAGKRILWVEDDFATLQSMLRPLERDGAEIRMVRTFREAVEAFRADRYDLVVLDVLLPWGAEDLNDEDEFQGLRFLQEVDLISGDTPVVMWTIVDADEVRSAAERRGINLDGGTIEIIPKMESRPRELSARLRDRLLERTSQ